MESFSNSINYKYSSTVLYNHTKRDIDALSCILELNLKGYFMVGTFQTCTSRAIYNRNIFNENKAHRRKKNCGNLENALYYPGS